MLDQMFGFLQVGGQFAWQPIAGFLIATWFADSLKDQVKDKALIGGVVRGLDNAAKTVGGFLPAEKKAA